MTSRFGIRCVAAMILILAVIGCAQEAETAIATPGRTAQPVPIPPNYVTGAPPEPTERPERLPGVIDHEQPAVSSVGVFGAESENGGVGLGFVRRDDRSLPLPDRPQTLEFELTSEEEFDPFVILANRSSVEKIVLLTAILDFQQIEFLLGGKSGILHQIRVPAATELEVPLSLGRLAPGMHDVMLMLFDDPFAGYDANTPAEVREARISHALSTAGRHVARRSVVIVDGGREPALDVQLAAEMSAPGPKEVPSGFPAILTRDSAPHPFEDQAFSIRGQIGSELPFRVLSSRFPLTGDAVHAVIYLLDYQQIDAGTGLADFFFVREGEEIVARRRVQLPPSPGAYHLLALVVSDPYRDLLGGGHFFDNYDTSNFRLVLFAE